MASKPQPEPAPAPVRALAPDEIAKLGYRPPRQLPGRGRPKLAEALKQRGRTPGGRSYQKGAETARDKVRNSLDVRDGTFVSCDDLLRLHPGAKVRVLGKKASDAGGSVRSSIVSIEAFAEANLDKLFFSNDSGDLWPLREDGSVRRDCCATLLDNEEEE